MSLTRSRFLLHIVAVWGPCRRIEPKGPTGFVDTTTFMVVDRSAFAGIPITVKSSNATHAILTTSAYTIEVTTPATPPAPPSPQPMCTATPNMDIADGSRISSCPMKDISCLPPHATITDCCNNCSASKECTAWIFDPAAGNCWLMASASGTKPAQDRSVGGNIPTSGGVLLRLDTSSFQAITVF